MDAYSIPELLTLLRAEGGERVLLDVGSSPTLIIKGELYEVEGPPVTEESVDTMLRGVASTREMRALRECGLIDIIVPFHGCRFLVRAVRAFGECKLELEPVAT